MNKLTLAALLLISACQVVLSSKGNEDVSFSAEWEDSHEERRQDHSPPRQRKGGRGGKGKNKGLRIGMCVKNNYARLIKACNGYSSNGLSAMTQCGKELDMKLPRDLMDLMEGANPTWRPPCQPGTCLNETGWGCFSDQARAKCFGQCVWNKLGMRLSSETSEMELEDTIFKFLNRSRFEGDAGGNGSAAAATGRLVKCLKRTVPGGGNRGRNKNRNSNRDPAIDARTSVNNNGLPARVTDDNELLECRVDHRAFACALRATRKMSRGCVRNECRLIQSEGGEDAADGEWTSEAAKK